jgi:hypothetical protein
MWREKVPEYYRNTLLARRNFKVLHNRITGKNTWSIILETSCQPSSLEGQRDWGYGEDSRKPCVHPHRNVSIFPMD